MAETGVAATIDRLRRNPVALVVALVASLVVGAASFTDAASRIGNVFKRDDPRAELAQLGIAFTPAAMTKAAADGDARAVGLLLDAGMPVDAASDPALPPLMLAAQSGSVVTVERLLAGGADPARDGAAGTALDYAVRYHHPEVLTLLLERPLPDAVLAGGLVAAAEGDDTASIALLAPRLADRRMASTRALHVVVDRMENPRSVATLAALLALTPDLNALDRNQRTLLHVAVGYDVIDVLNALLRAGADPRVAGRCDGSPDELPVTPLACAVVRGSVTGLASAHALIAAGAEVDARGPDGTTPLMLAAGNGDAAASAALLAAGADPLARDARGRTAVAYARSARFGDRAATLAAVSQAAARRRS